MKEGDGSEDARLLKDGIFGSEVGFKVVGVDCLLCVFYVVKIVGDFLFGYEFFLVEFDEFVLAV